MEAAYIRMHGEEEMPQLRDRRRKLSTDSDVIEYYFVQTLPE